jgi:deferrochelatase/peroxidase EfeB
MVFRRSRRVRTDQSERDASRRAHVTPVDAHIALANQAANAIHFLRRGYNFTDGLDPTLGQLDAGLFSSPISAIRARSSYRCRTSSPESML